MTKNTGHEFFELFRRAPDEQKQGARSASKVPAASRDLVEEQPHDASGHATPRGGKRFAWGLEEVVVSGLVVAVMLVASHVWGYYRGRASTQQRAGVAAGPRTADATRRGGTSGSHEGGTPDSGSPVSQERLTVPTGNERAPFVTLQVIGGIPLERARQVAADLTKEGYRAVFVYQPRNSRGFTVNVGRFSSQRDSALTRLKDEFAAKSYRGERAFQDCLKMKISDPRRIKR